MAKRENKGDCTVIEFDIDEVDLAQGTVELNDEQHLRLINYLLTRLRSSKSKRMSRIRRMAKIDQSIVTWQKLTPEDSQRERTEESTGRQQALPINMPIIQAHVDDTVAFFSEIFAPIGGNFYSLPGQAAKTAGIDALTKKMNQDTQINNYYGHVTQLMRQLCKYNIGGLEVSWNPGDAQGTGVETMPGNVCESIDMYNFDWDTSVKEPDKVAKDAEWAVRYRIRNRLWIMRLASKGLIINTDKIFGKPEESGNAPFTIKSEFYRYPPTQTNMATAGNDDSSGYQNDEGSQIDWNSFGLGDGDEGFMDIDGYEIAKMYCWINPNQFDLAEDDQDSLQLWQFIICNGATIISAMPMSDEREIPCYLGRVNKDNMNEMMRSISEYIRPFQRFVSFLVNTHVAAVRKAIWGKQAYDPTMFDMSNFANGEVAGLIPSKIPGRDVRTGFMDLQNKLDTRDNIADAASFMEFMKQFFPNQSLPAQIAGMDRAVSSQVSAVLQGAMRKMHMLGRLVDSDVMLPSRQAQYRNIARFDPDKAAFASITEEDVAALLSSGIGQINRQAAAEQVREVIFALIQNPDSSARFDLPGLFAYWSVLLDTGTNLGAFVLPQQAAAAPPAQGDSGAAGGVQPGVPQEVPADASQAA